jgi:hypothetical protein
MMQLCWVNNTKMGKKLKEFKPPSTTWQPLGNDTDLQGKKPEMDKRIIALILKCMKKENNQGSDIAYRHILCPKKMYRC